MRWWALTWIALAAVALGTAPAASAAGWTLQSTPNPAGAVFSQVEGVSCVSATRCTAVGYYENRQFTDLALAEVWDGTTWSLQTTPNRSGSRESVNVLYAVSCLSAADCVAVGNYFNNRTGVEGVLSEIWNGSGWTIRSAPSPSGGSGAFLQGISCPSSAECVAVGGFTDPGGTEVTLAERWNGTAWAVRSTPNPSGATSSHLSAVSCSAADACTAVGTFTNAAGTRMTLAERWDGSTWTLQTPVNPNGASDSELAGVSCFSLNACAAIGSFANSAGTNFSLAEVWNGTAWVVQSTPNPTGSTFTVLSAVSCPSASVCVADGYFTNSTGDFVTLAERWNGTRWSIQATPNPAGATRSFLFGLSCPAANFCSAAGYSGNVTLAEGFS